LSFVAFIFVADDDDEHVDLLVGVLEVLGYKINIEKYSFISVHEIRRINNCLPWLQLLQLLTKYTNYVRPLKKIESQKKSIFLVLCLVWPATAVYWRRNRQLGQLFEFHSASLDDSA
jgi:hypothetical protein